MKTAFGTVGFSAGSVLDTTTTISADKAHDPCSEQTTQCSKQTQPSVSSRSPSPRESQLAKEIRLVGGFTVRACVRAIELTFRSVYL